ncbi:MAG TPA: ubiquinone/menaquinone biosynthesis methyltransferase [Chthoniobacterales bacterium]
MKRGYVAQDAGSIRRMFSQIAARYDLANACLSGGLDGWWRLYVARLLACWQPRNILDLATGSGALAATLRRTLPGAQLVGADFCAPLLARSRRRGLENLVVADALALPFRDAVFDAVTVAFGLRNMASYDEALLEMRRVLAPEGHVVILDFSLPQGPLLPLYRLYLHHVLPRLAGWLTGVPEAYTYLAESIEQFPRGRRMLQLLERTGFVDAGFRPLSGGIVSVYAARRGKTVTG